MEFTTSKERRRGKVSALYNEDEQKQFLLSRAIKNGFKVDENSLRISQKSTETLYKKGLRKVNLLKVVYDGVMTVEDPSLLVDLLCHGMGREKAYGFGMMTIARIS